MDEDDLDLVDVRHAILHGEISAELTEDSRGSSMLFAGRFETKMEEWMLSVDFCRQDYCV
jgi:hypothetical protein